MAKKWNRYEAEKKRLAKKPLTSKDYEKAIKAFTRKRKM